MRGIAISVVSRVYMFLLCCCYFTLPVRLADLGMPTARSALPFPVKSPIANEYPK